MKKVNKMDLQLFAEEKDSDEDKGVDEGKDEKVDASDKTYTHDEFEAKLQSETDKRVTSALKKQEKKLDERLREADKLREMSEEQKKRYKIEQREKQLTKKEKEYAIMENKIECSNILSDRGLPKEFLEYVVAEDAEQMLENIDKMDRTFTSAVSDAVNAKIGKKTPNGSKDKQTGMNKAKFKELSVAQQSEIYKTNKTLWKEMNN